MSACGSPSRTCSADTWVLAAWSPSSRSDIGHSATSAASLGAPLCAEIFVQRRIDHGEYHVVHLAAEPPARSLDAIERQRADPHRARVAGERTVHQRARRVEGNLVETVFDLHPLQAHPRQGPRQFGHSPGLRQRRAPGGSDARGDVRFRTWRRCLLLEGPRRREDRARRRRRQRGVHAPHARHTVNAGMVDLGVDGKAIAMQPLDHLAEPARPLAVEHAAVQAFYRVEQLARVARDPATPSGARGNPCRGFRRPATAACPCAGRVASS